MEFLKEFFEFLKDHKKLWLAPIFLLLILIGSLLIVAEGSVFAPFIYSFF